MKEIKLKCGPVVRVNEKVLTDMEFLDDLREANEGDPTATSALVLKLLGKEQRKVLYANLRDAEGFVPAEKVSEVIIEIFEAFGDKGKNS